MSSKNGLIVFFVLLLWAGYLQAQSANQGYPSPELNHTNDQVKQAILEQLHPFALLHNGLYYVRFTIASDASPPQQQGGFAPPVMPQGAPIVSQDGIMEITPFRWSFSLFPDSAGGERGTVSLRLRGYRVFYPQKGWSAQNLLMLHFWEWDVHVDKGRVNLSANMNNSNFKTDNGPREFIASIFNISPDAVTVHAADLRIINQILSPEQPQTGGCRPCETEQPDGSCKQWRVC